MENKKLVGVCCALGALPIFAAVAIMGFGREPECEVDANVSFAQAIGDHRLAREGVGYLHDGKDVFRRQDIFFSSTNGTPCVAFFALDEVAGLENPTFWQKVRGRCSALVNRLSFDENSAVVLSKNPPSDTLQKGCYVHLGSLRVEMDAKVVGTYVYEFPFYVDDSFAGAGRRELLADFHGEFVSALREMVHGMVEPNESYKVTETPNGAVLTKTFVRFVFEIRRKSPDARET